MSFLPPKRSLTAEINLMPLVDCLLLLTCYLLISTTFVGLSFLASQVVRPSTQANPPVNYDYVVVTLSDEGRISLDPSNDRDELPAILALNKSGYDFNAFSRAVKALPAKYKELVFLPTAKTSYQTLVQFTEIARKHSRSVVLSGDQRR